jgi:hypothetical protein
MWETNVYPHKMLARHCLYLEVSNTKFHQDMVSTVSVGDEICRLILTVNLLCLPLRFTKHGWRNDNEDDCEVVGNVKI